MKIYENGELIRDFIPCYSNKIVEVNKIMYRKGTLGLYDNKNNKFYPNLGKGTFIAGSEVE